MFNMGGMKNYINQYKQLKTAIEYISEKGYTVNIRQNEKPIMVVGKHAKPNFVLKNTVGNVKVNCINTVKLIYNMKL
ncbi:hypothetical protein [Methanococcus voltae]|jgi:hypothetical protein|uniref:hypothetical protein n=1 Tax=Methanococcus voltae TaxID=2188 RepID=UPI001FDA49AE|nr:hypothetical protein [Methanococcus voltae]